MAKRSAAVLLLLALAAPCAAQLRPTTEGERQRLLELVSRVEQDPLGPKVKAEQQWAVNLIATASDIQVVISGGLSVQLLRRIPEKNEYRNLLFGQFVVACGADTIRNKGKPDPVRMNLYALKSCLAVYKTLVKDHPERKIEGLDEWLKKDDAGLTKIVQEALQRQKPAPK